MGRWQRALLAAGLALLVIGGGTGSAGATPDGTNGRVEVTPDDPGATAVHTIAAPVDRGLAGEWRQVEIVYSYGGALREVDVTDVTRIGVDRSSDESGGAIDVDLHSRVENASVRDGDTLLVRFSGPVALEPGDEIVVTVRNATNPPERAVEPVWIYAHGPERDSESVTVRSRWDSTGRTCPLLT